MGNEYWCSGQGKVEEALGRRVIGAWREVGVVRSFD